MGRYFWNRRLPILAVAVLVLSSLTHAAENTPVQTGNDPERVELFRDLGLGLFIHWGVDSQLGSVISHSMVGATDDYLDRFFNELPKTFNPTDFNPEKWAVLAKLAGMKYVVFTTKHFSGFSMFDTAYSDFNVMNTPYGRDITREITEAFRAYDIRVGYYYSPEDNWLLHRQGYDISRMRPEASIKNNPELRRHILGQLGELLSNYGPIEMLFIDGEAEGVKQLAWQMQPEIIITRGEMETPEQRMPDEPIPGPWEACETIGTQWQFKPTNEHYKSGTRLIEILVEIRAKGGNLLLNVGPTPGGEIPFEQERRLRELGLWLFANGEAIYDIRPWHVIREGNVWFTKKKDGNTVYAIVTGEPWPRGERRTVTLASVRATAKTVVSVLGQTGRVLEYHPDVDPMPSWTQDEGALTISAMRSQRFYDQEDWPNPVVIKITNVEAAER